MKLKRVVKSTLTAETLALPEAIMIKYMFSEILKIQVNKSQVKNRIKKVRVISNKRILRKSRNRINVMSKS